jgi:hypothetical protein
MWVSAARPVGPCFEAPTKKSRARKERGTGGALALGGRAKRAKKERGKLLGCSASHTEMGTRLRQMACAPECGVWLNAGVCHIGYGCRIVAWKFGAAPSGSCLAPMGHFELRTCAIPDCAFSFVIECQRYVSSSRWTTGGACGDTAAQTATHFGLGPRRLGSPMVLTMIARMRCS